MPEQHVKLFAGLGIPQEVIDQIEGVTPEQAKDWNADSVSAPVRAALKKTLQPDFLNDAEFLKSIPEDKVPEEVRKKVEAGQYGRFMQEVGQVAKKLGLEDTDFSDMSEEEKKSLKTYVGKIAEKYLSKKGSVEGAKELQRQVSKLTDDLEAKDKTWQEKLDADLQKVNGSANAKVIKALTRAEMQGLKDELEIGVPVAYITEPVLAKLNAKYSVVLTDGDELQLKQKADSNLDVMENGKPLTFAQALKNIVVEEKIGKVKDSKQQPGPGDKKKVIIGGVEGEPGAFELPASIADKVKRNEDLEK